MAQKIKVVLAGCGSISRAWLNTDNAEKKIDIVGLVDINTANAEKIAQDYNFRNAAIDTNLGRILKKTKPEAVFDCSIPSAHRDITITALKHGCHVLGEKPMAESMADAEKMVAAARKSGKIYAVIQNRRYLPQIRALKAFLESGRIGRLVTIQSNFFIGAHFGGFRDEMKHVLLVDMAIHTFDAARFITGSDARSVYCHDWNPAGSWYKHGASAVAIFEMTNGIIYTYEGSWASEGCNTKWEAQWRIIGTKGTVVWDGGDNFDAETPAADTGLIWKQKKLKVPSHCPKKYTGGHNGVIGAFIESLKSGVAPETVCTDNIKSIAMVLAAVESSEKGRKIKIKPHF